MQIELPEIKVGASGLNRYITALNSHDGSTSIGFGTTNTVVICSNTFYQAFKSLSRIRHTQSYSTRVKAAIDDIKLSLSSEERLVENFKIMADTKATDDFAQRLVKNVLNIKGPDSDVSTRKKNQVNKIASDIRKDIDIHGDNLWGLFNGITRYTNHSATTPNKKDEYVMIGQGARMNKLALNMIENEISKALDNASILV